ncbi:hypothetical protein GBA52_014013 [Prunus armeniaca]|nr:hypothetical protein GBA52_014013 [Prunus armeniaca]
MDVHDQQQLKKSRVVRVRKIAPDTLSLSAPLSLPQKPNSNQTQLQRAEENGENTTMLMSMADQKTQAPKAKQTGMFTGNTLTSPWHYFSDHPCSSSLSYSSPFSSALCNWVWFELGF